MANLHRKLFSRKAHHGTRRSGDRSPRDAALWPARLKKAIKNAIKKPEPANICDENFS
jgi:hypothetical protein